MNPLKKKLSTPLIVIGAAVLGLLGGVAAIASAQSATTSAPATVTSTTSQSQSAVDTPESANDPADSLSAAGAQHHAPLGGDGVVSSISGTTIVMSEESDEGGSSYTVDASKATVSNNGTTSSLSDLKVGDKVFVQGTVSGTNVVATSISLGHPGGHPEGANDTDGTSAQETSESSSSSASDQ